MIAYLDDIKYATHLKCFFFHSDAIQPIPLSVHVARTEGTGLRQMIDSGQNGKRQSISGSPTI